MVNLEFYITRVVTLILLSTFNTSAFAQTTVASLQQDWAIANYQTASDDIDAVFSSLIDEADAAVISDPDNAGLRIWQGIIKSTYAGKAGGLSALSLIKAARASFEQAMALDDMAMSGSAYTSLGALYYQVPGWPIAFGSDKKARALLEKAIAIDPDGIDSNYFYGEFLFEQKAYSQARARLTTALNASPRAGRAVADEGRRAEIRFLLKKIEKKSGD